MNVLNLPVVSNHSNLGPDVYSITKDFTKDQKKISATLYDASSEIPMDVTFWSKERSILLALYSLKVFFDDKQPKAYYHIYYIVDILEKLGFITHNGCSWENDDNVIRSVSILKEIVETLSYDFLNNLNMALAELLDDYTKPASYYGRKYMMVLHRFDRPNIIYMTMSIRIHKDKGEYYFEHRHICQSVASLVRPAIAKIYSSARILHENPPRGLSMLMHKVSLFLISAIHPEIKRLDMEPLMSMYKIFQKHGFVGPAKNPKASSVSVSFDKEQIERLIRYDGLKHVKFVDAKAYCGSCLIKTTTQMCANCFEPLVCNDAECIQQLKHNCCL